MNNLYIHRKYGRVRKGHNVLLNYKMSLTAYQDLFALRAIEKAFVVYFPRADGAKRRARVLIPPRLFTPGETKALAMTSQTAPD